MVTPSSCVPCMGGTVWWVTYVLLEVLVMPTRSGHDGCRWSFFKGTSYLFPLTGICGKKPSEAYDAQGYLFTSGTARSQP